MDCNQTGNPEEIAKAFSSLDPMSQESAENVLREAHEIMQQLGVTFFLRQGTCLGAVRDNAIMPWDDDIDIGSLIGHHGLTQKSLPDVLKQVVNVFTERGFSTISGHTAEFHWISMIKSSVRIDWECFKVIRCNILHFPSQWFPARLFQNLKEIDFLGTTFLIPNPPEEYLALKYGPEWRTPKKAGAYENDVLDTIPEPPTIEGFKKLKELLLSRIFKRPPAKLLVLDDQGIPVPGANVMVVGVGKTKTDERGCTNLFIHNDFQYALTIQYRNHKELLYIENLTPGTSYIYRADPSSNSGRAFVLSAN